MTLFFFLLSQISPPTGVIAKDTPNDKGGSITIQWRLSKDDTLLEGYDIERREEKGEFKKVGFVGRGRRVFKDDRAKDGVRYYYRVVAKREGERVASEVSNVVTSSPQWFHTGRVNVLAGTIVIIFLFVGFIQSAKGGKRFFIRRIAGLDAVEEAIGRATEMGKPILYIPGTSDMRDVATIASLNILGEVAKKAAQYDTPLMVPNRDPIVYTVAREIVKESYSSVGRPDAFNPDSVFFVTTSQFAYAAAVDGIMVRENPATIFLLGMFWAESLILAETGASTGAIQIAGTDSTAQLPFFITACDYTLIGEELYAASAYISREPVLLGTLRGQDMGKLIITGLILLGSIVGLLTKFPVLSLFE